jgi:hypothetical protein
MSSPLPTRQAEQITATNLVLIWLPETAGRELEETSALDAH